MSNLGAPSAQSVDHPKAPGHLEALFREIENSLDRISTATSKLDGLHQRLFGATPEPDQKIAGVAAGPTSVENTGAVKGLQFLARRLEGGADRLIERVNSFEDLT
jgi:hypothetical protein